MNFGCRGKITQRPEPTQTKKSNETCKFELDDGILEHKFEVLGVQDRVDMGGGVDCVLVLEEGGDNAEQDEGVERSNRFEVLLEGDCDDVLHSQKDYGSDQGAQRLPWTFVYAKCAQKECKELWEHLCSISNVGVPWVVLGDFNIICSNEKRVGGRSRPISAMEDFNECINNCGLIDFRLDGRQLSWCNGQLGMAISWARLDRVLVNNVFVSKFGEATVHLLCRRTSDHLPILLQLTSSFVRYGPAPFQFQNMWASHVDFLKVVANSWKESIVCGSGLFTLAGKLKRLKFKLRSWNREVFGRVDGTIHELEVHLEVLEGVLHSNFYEAIEEEYLVTKRMRNLCVKEMKLPNGLVLDLPERVHDEAVRYFEEFLSHDGMGSLPNLDFLFQQALTTSEFSWNIVSDDVMEAVREFFMSNELLRFYSSLFIVLIPKVKNLQSFDKFRPISLCKGSLCEEVEEIEDLNVKLRDLVVNERWDVDRLELLLGAQKMEQVGSSRNAKDILLWLPEKNGLFSTKSAWNFIRLRMPKFDWEKWIWNSLLPKKISICLWKATFSCFSVDEQVRFSNVKTLFFADLRVLQRMDLSIVKERSLKVQNLFNVVSLQFLGPVDGFVG
ncbi:hypothetical protein F2P56_035145 [Juglans regia]|uniref:Reverse transcriptase zinc-binding domain-containing protein n=2 Tax=Juglans regia TaxID=51240 RepID=A0A833WBJ5_JUGRE|nr:uncharacterized protein LOC108992159 [Juglans regia]KAF5442493.1 hypothetical protein F2P56_035145 [Juglans regia]